MQVGSYALAYSNTQSLQLTFSQAGSGSHSSACAPSHSRPNDKVSLSTDGLAASAADAKQPGTDLSPAMSMLKNVLHKMFGIDVQMVDVQQLHAETSDSVSAATAAIQQTGGDAVSQSASSFLYQEDHSSAFSMSGTLTTKDGQQLSFSLDFALASHLSYSAAQASNTSSTDKHATQSFTLGNDAGALSGASVMAALTQLFQTATDTTAAASSDSNADANKNAIIPLLAHFKLWADDAAKPLADHKLRALAQPKAEPDKHVVKHPRHDGDALAADDSTSPSVSTSA